MSELALKLIEENKRTKSPFLDLGNCGLTELPKELFDCIWLEGLNLGIFYRNEENKWIETKNKGKRNHFEINQLIGANFSFSRPALRSVHFVGVFFVLRTATSLCEVFDFVGVKDVL